MSEVSPKDIDKLFQQGSKKFNFEYNPEAWEQMDVLLSKNSRRRKTLWWFGSLIAISTIGLIWSNSMISEGLILKGTKSSFSSSTIPIQKRYSHPTKVDSTFALQSQNESSDKMNEFNKNFGNIDVQNSNRKSKNNTSHGLSSKKKINAKTIDEEKSLIVTNTDTSQHRKLNENSLNYVVTPEKSTHNGIQDPLAKTSERISLSEMKPLSISFIEYSYQQIVSSKHHLDNIVGNLNITPSPDAESKIENVIRLGFIAAEEITTTNFNEFSSANWKIGIQVEYQLNNNFSTTLGANFIQKEYYADIDDYQAPQGFWLGKNTPIGTDVLCNIVEIPIGVTFSPKSNKENGLFVSLGLTSYLMLIEKYNYIVDSNDPSLDWNWDTEEPNKHWFGIGTASIGYQHTISKDTQIKLAPYVQLPIAGVGHGNVKLWTTGISAAISFKLK